MAGVKGDSNRAAPQLKQPRNMQRCWLFVYSLAEHKLERSIAGMPNSEAPVVSKPVQTRNSGEIGGEMSVVSVWKSMNAAIFVGKGRRPVEIF